MSVYNVTGTMLMYIISFNPMKTYENYFLREKIFGNVLFLKNFIKMFLTNQEKAYLPVKEIILILQHK